MNRLLTMINVEKCTINIIRTISMCLILGFFTGYSSSQNFPRDLKESIENPELEKMIDKLVVDKSKETKLKLMEELNKANFLVPVLTDKLETSESDKKGFISLENDSDIMVLSMSDGKGNEYMPLFTDLKAIEGWSDKEFNTLVMPAEKVWSFVLGEPQFNGVIVNPGAKALPLKKDTIEFLKSQSKVN